MPLRQAGRHSEPAIDHKRRQRRGRSHIGEGPRGGGGERELGQIGEEVGDKYKRESRQRLVGV